MTREDEIVSDDLNPNRDATTPIMNNSDSVRRSDLGMQNEESIGQRSTSTTEVNRNFKQRICSYFSAFHDWWICTHTITKVKLFGFVILPCMAIGFYIFHFSQHPGSLHNPIAVLHPLSVVHPVVPSPFHFTVKFIEDTAKGLLSNRAEVTVTTSKGPIVGQKYNPHPVTGASYDAFLGIPYGHIPARFQQAVPPSGWTTPRSAKTDGPACPQNGTDFSEDCLYINVFMPSKAVDSSAGFPVIAFIHDSVFTRGSSSSKRYGPDFLVPKGIVLVTFNYRLGANGFLTLGSRDAPGNMGLYDIQLALRWVQDEIYNFGGDPSQVTLMGQGAGAVMAMYLYLSPSSHGLFRSVVAHSGSALAGWGRYSVSEGRSRAKSLAIAVGCDSSADDAQILDCLRATNMSYIVASQSVPLDIHFEATGQTMPFLPVLDTDVTEVPFFTDTLSNLLDRAASRNLPLMLGFTADEGIVKFAEESCWKNVDSNLDAFIPPRVASLLSRRRIAAVETSIRRQYFSSDSKVWGIVRILGDHMITYPALQVARKLANSSYGFVFDFHGPWTPNPPYTSKFHTTGVNHGFDLRYLFYDSVEPQDLGNCSSLRDSLIVRDMMVGWWTNFVKTRTPGNNWPTISKGGFLKINPKPILIDSETMENDCNYEFWKSLETLQDDIWIWMSANIANKNSSMSMMLALLCMMVIMVQ
ncbi:juvenile hormone esterase-like [Macrosteles quadrilineatus]|uniref:juvenile hormone esterase-like n=1 Tax=Macrosteles quadrilineatus TaxID=74068 RepID=UPI0023E10674|nr:juvenile hormone esterase-like [Macrosteles quadrilineatus]